MKAKTGTCLDCSAAIQAKSKRCAKCATLFVNTDPGVRVRRAEAIRQKWADPTYRAKMAPICRRNGQVGAADPEHHAWLIEHGKRMARQHLHTEEGRAANAASRARAGQARSETVMAWCWPELREEYRYLTISRRKRAAEARAIIEKKMADIEAARSPDFSAAVDWLRRLAPIKRLDNGTYQHGSAILSAGEVMARAKFRGFEPINYFKEPLKSANSNSEQSVKMQEELRAA